MNNQYINYNLVRVIICGEYPITNVQTKGLPGDDCGCHLESLTIESEVVGANNPKFIGAKGVINVIDYKDSVIHKLIKTLKEYINAGGPDKDASKQYLPTVQIDIECFTGSTRYCGHIENWQLNFVGTTPTLSLQWRTVDPNSVNIEPMPYYSHWNDPVKLISKLSQTYHPHTPIVGPDDKEIKSGSLVFINPEGVDVNMASLPSCGNREVDVYFFIAQNSKFNGKLVTGEYHKDKEKSKFKLVYRQAKENDTKTEEGKISNKLIFVQNGSYAPYKARDVDGKIVIPMTSFNYTLDMNKLAISGRVIENKNGTMVFSTSGYKPNSINQSEANSNQKDGATADASTNSAIEVSFECYNVMAFSKNNLNEPIEYEIYNEFGQKHITTGRGTVTALTYTISGGSVVKASVTCTEKFSDSITDVKKEAQENASGAGGNSATETASQAAAKDTPKDDENPIPLSADKTELCLSNGVFNLHVAEFIDKYGDLKKTDRLLDYTFIQKLVKAGNYGLLTLLIAVANYGVKNVPSTWKVDPVNEHQEFVNKSPFCASGDGKTPYDCKRGGLGIAHWDSENLQTIYTSCGFDPSLSSNDKSKLQKLFIATPPYKSHHTGKCTGWRYGTFKGMTRIFPEFEKKPKPSIRKFDDGLKEDDTWLNWAKDLLYYNRNGLFRKYQEFLFEMWIKEFWIPVKKNVAASSRPRLQDVIRISRISNSYGGLKSKLPGESVSEQFRKYIIQQPAKVIRYSKQFYFCQRACKIAEYEMSIT